MLREDDETLRSGVRQAERDGPDRLALDQADGEGQPGPKEPGMRGGQKTNAEQVVLKLCQIDVQTAQGEGLALACREAEISEQSYYRWRKEYGVLQVDQAKIMKDLECKNARLRRLVDDLSLEKQLLADVASGNL